MTRLARQHSLRMQHANHCSQRESNSLGKRAGRSRVNTLARCAHLASAAASSFVCSSLIAWISALCAFSRSCSWSRSASSVSNTPCMFSGMHGCAGSVRVVFQSHSYIYSRICSAAWAVPKEYDNEAIATIDANIKTATCQRQSSFVVCAAPSAHSEHCNMLTSIAECTLRGVPHTQTFGTVRRRHCETHTIVFSTPFIHIVLYTRPRHSESV
jgi:hypothetical protein